jgi:hypothetical protein
MQVSESWASLAIVIVGVSCRGGVERSLKGE